MADARNHRNREVGEGAAELLVVKDHQILATASATGEHQSIGLQRLWCVFELVKNCTNSFSDITLYGDGHDHQLRQRPAFPGRAKYVG